MQTVFLKSKSTSSYVSIRPDGLHETHYHYFDMEGRLTGELRLERSEKSQEAAVQYYTEQLRYEETTREEYLQARYVALIAVSEYRGYYPPARELTSREEFLADLHNAA